MMRSLVGRSFPGLALAIVFTAIGAADAAAAPEGAAASALHEPDPLFDDDFEDEFAGAHDPTRRDSIEGFNRLVFGLNQGLDWVVWSPATRAYRFAVPAPARRAVHRMFLNLTSTSILVNKLLQLRFVDAATVLGRLVLNTTVGWGGLFDPALEAGWEYQRADFGQTLAYAGMPSGGYLVLPFFGPSTYRDGFGTIADQFMLPTLYFLGPIPHLYVGSGFGLSLRESVADEIQALEDSSIDFYSVMRSAYWQYREAELGLTGRPAAVKVKRVSPPQNLSAEPEARSAILASSAESSPPMPSR